MKREQRPDWPAWLDPLRPDEVTRARLRATIRGRATPILDSRRLGSWQDVAAGWATMLVPIAAVLLLFFGGLAYQATPRTIAAAPVTLEELIGEQDPEDGFGALTSTAEPSRDWALTAVMRHDNGYPRDQSPPGQNR